MAKTKGYKGPQSDEQVVQMIAHLMKSLFICMNCGRTMRGRDVKLSRDAPVRFKDDGLTPQFQCPRCKSWDFELVDAPKP